MSRPERLGRAVRVLVIPMLDAKARRQLRPAADKSGAAGDAGDRVAQGLPARRRASRLRARPTVRRCTPVRRRRHPPPRADPPAQPAPRPLHHRGPEQERISPPAAGDRRATRTNRHAARPTARQAEDALPSSAAKFWDTETEAAERRRLVAALIDRVWQDKGVVVAVKPREPFMRDFKAADELAQRRTRNTRSIPGATGLEPATSGVTDRQEGAPSLIKPHELRMVEPNPGNAVLVHVALWGRAGCHVTAKPEASCC